MKNLATSNTHRASKVVFATFSPQFKNVHLTKDVGMIPWILHRDFGYDSYVICYKNENCYHLEKTPGLKLIFMKHIKIPYFNVIKPICEKSQILRAIDPFMMLDALFTILKTGRFISVLQLYHPSSVVLGLIYRMVNRKGILYLKLDLSSNIVELFKSSPIKMKVEMAIVYLFFKLARFDILSIETKSLYKFLKTQTPFLKESKKLHYIPNGVDVNEISPFTVSFDKKENIILHIGRIGSYQKGSEIILKAFAQVAKDFPTWRLLLIGSMESRFRRFFERFLKTIDGNVSDRISYLGFLSRKELLECMSKAKVLAMPSRWEGFSLTSIEAGSLGCVILGTDIPCLREITNNGEFGYLCRVNNFHCFAEMLRYMLSHEDELTKKSEAIKKFIRSNYNWETILEKLHKIILKILSERVENEAKTKGQYVNCDY